MKQVALMEPHGMLYHKHVERLVQVIVHMDVLKMVSIIVIHVIIILDLKILLLKIFLVVLVELVVYYQIIVMKMVLVNVMLAQKALDLLKHQVLIIKLVWHVVQVVKNVLFNKAQEMLLIAKPVKKVMFRQR